MGGINELSDELLIKILSYLPTKDAISTSVLSKQWQFLWMWLPNLQFRNSESDFKSLRRFLRRNLPFHRAPVIESFNLNLNNLDRVINLKDIKLWILFAVFRDVRELDISYSSDYVHEDDILPISLYTCKSLITLKLNNIFMDVPRDVSLPSLKCLRFEDVIYDNENSLSLLLSNCPVLEDLSIVDRFDGFGKKMIVIVSSLQRLLVEIRDYDLDEFVIDTPSLKYLQLYCHQKILYTSFKNMPKLKEVFVEGLFSLFANLIVSIPSVKRLTLCLSLDNMSEVVFDDGFVLNKLKHLKLCTYHDYSSHVLVQLLKVSPNLQELELFRKNVNHKTYRHYWNQPSTVPECILTSLEMFKWSGYQGSKEERELVSYILQNACCLETATILLCGDLDKTFDIKKELELSSRVSTRCKLVFL